MRVALDARTATEHFPGIGRYVAGLSSGIQEADPRLPVRLLADPRNTLWWRPPQWALIPAPWSPFSLSQHWKLKPALRRNGITLYHSTYYPAPCFQDIPTVWTCCDLIPLIFPRFFPRWQRTVFRIAHRVLVERCRHILAISASTRSDLLRFFPVRPEKISVIPLGVDPRFVPRGRDEIQGMRRRIGLPEKYVLYVGINKPHKNLVTLLKAWRDFRQEARPPGDDVRLVLAGPWDERYPEAKAYAARGGLQGEVLFVGPVEEDLLPSVYSGALAFVFPSLYEGFGLPVLEAMACGTPVLCAHTSGLPEVCGDAALYFDPRQSRTLAEGLRRVLEDAALREDLRSRGLSRASAFSWARTARETIQIYRKHSI